MSECYLYVIARSDEDGALIGPVKIGIGAEPWKRARELQTGSPYPLRVAVAFHAQDRSTAAAAERHLHERLERYRMEGEWFDLRPDHALAYVWCLMDGTPFEAVDACAIRASDWAQRRERLRKERGE